MTEESSSSSTRSTMNVLKREGIMPANKTYFGDKRYKPRTSVYKPRDQDKQAEYMPERRSSLVSKTLSHVDSYWQQLFLNRSDW